MSDSPVPPPLSSCSSSAAVARVSAAGRSVQDYETEEQLRNALSAVCIADGTPAASSAAGTDWLLPVPDAEAEEQTIDGELQRLLNLKSYLLLDAAKEEAFDRLTEEARQLYRVPTSLISLVDLGRQFLFSNTGNPGDIRETPRSLAFCAHTILNKNAILVVNDTLKDERFMHSKLVTEPPFLRFYAAAPLVSPEGYKLGTFCIEGPEPRPEGLTPQETARLKEYAERAMALMVERRKALKDRLDNNVVSIELQRHAAVTTNLGAILYADYNDPINAMRLYQEAVQTLMYVEGENQGGTPSKERQEIMSQLLGLLSVEGGDPKSLEPLARNVTMLYPATNITNPCNKAEWTLEKPLESIPGLFSTVSKLKGIHSSDPRPCLVFGEPFKIDLDFLSSPENASGFRECPFLIPVNQCSKATLFNMGLIHYQAGAADTAVQFFDLAASLSAKSTPVAFDPVVLGCLNNMAQINLQYRRPNDAMEMLSDALARGNAALANLYAECDRSSDMSQSDEEDIKYSRRLRRKLARTVLNMAHVRFFNCEYSSAMAACMDALRLMHNNLEEMEVAAIWYNIALNHYHQGNKAEALVNFDKFVDMVLKLRGANHYQLADVYHRQGQIYFEMGNLYKGVKPLNEALRLRRLVLGENHVLVAETLCLQGQIYQAREEFDFALTALSQAVEIQRINSREEKNVSFDLAHTLIQLGRTYHWKGEIHKSLEAYLEAAQLTKSFFGERHLFVARIESILGTLYLEIGKVADATAAFERATKIKREQGLPDEDCLAPDILMHTKMEQKPVAPTA